MNDNSLDLNQRDKADMLDDLGPPDPHIPSEGRRIGYKRLAKRGPFHLVTSSTAHNSFMLDEGARYDPSAWASVYARTDLAAVFSAAAWRSGFATLTHQTVPGESSGSHN